MSANHRLGRDDKARRFARLVAEELADIFRTHGTFAAADVSPRPTSKEGQTWRDEEKGRGSLDPIPSENSGESLLLEQEAKEIVGSIRRKTKRGR
jgi:hypothetical protein